MTDMTDEIPRLFTPIKLRAIVARNRIVCSPMCQYVSDDGGPGEWQLVNFGRFAMGGCGIVFGEGRAEFRGLGQIVLLSPGRYRFKSQFKGNMVGRRGLEWRVDCLDGQKPLGRIAVPLGSTQNWSNADIEFTVPEANRYVPVAI